MKKNLDSNRYAHNPDDGRPDEESPVKTIIID